MLRSGSLLPFFGFLKVTGSDAAVFLHNQLSNDIQNLPENQALYACYSSPKGRVLANMLVLNTADGFLLMFARDLCEPIAKRLQMFVMRSKVVIEQVSDHFSVAGILPENTTAPSLFEVMPLTLPSEFKDGAWQINLPHGGAYLISEQLVLLPKYQAETEQAWQALEITHGYPWISAATTETCVAQMLNLHILGAVNFKKGCYPGQEIIARAQYRGQVKRGLAIIEASAPLPVGASILNEAQEDVGLVINSVQGDGLTRALVVIKFGAKEQSLHVEEASVKVSTVFFKTDEE